ncbi:Serine/threonine protein kinase [Rhodotorula toruloides ATCC 204091]|uniref:Serine/threonine protein kinase n=1 Tax=Rhodotorula toruloides TaxID=5286 RepID=A0A0K3CN43_RHOTO|nr:Serine/threonine protein kinase [Rhodotorula toruloides ATCC 204091]PRQ70993.1 Serine/threonine protein kinase [Rhodotorula toruloides]
MFATRSSRRFYAVAITLTVPSCVAIGYYLRDTTDPSNALIAASPTLTATGPPTEPLRLKPSERAQLVKERFAVEERKARLTKLTSRSSHSPPPPPRAPSPPSS